MFLPTHGECRLWLNENINYGNVDVGQARRLFRQVILQQFRDACQEIPEQLGDMPVGWVPRPRKNARNYRSPKAAWARRRLDARHQRLRVLREVYAARKWLLQGEELEEVCVLAGWDPGYIRSGVNRLRERNWIPFGTAFLDRDEEM